MSVTRTGLDQAALIPVGATIARVYWSAPGLYTVGEPFEYQEECLLAALNAAEVAAARAAKYDDRSLIPETITIDQRWQFKFPNGGGVDTIVTRTVYDTHDDVREHLARLLTYPIAR